MGDRTAIDSFLKVNFPMFASETGFNKERLFCDEFHNVKDEFLHRDLPFYMRECEDEACKSTLKLLYSVDSLDILQADFEKLLEGKSQAVNLIDPDVSFANSSSSP